MSEHVGNPFTSYNSTGNVRTLVGNWQEEQVLKHVTGTLRSKTVALQHQTAQDEALAQTVFAVRQDEAVHEPTHSRVIEHSEQLLAAEWLTHNTVNYQPPAARTFDLSSYPKAKQCGPREEQALKALYQEAAVERAQEPDSASFDTTQRSSFQAHNLEGFKIGARVMKTQDGNPVSRDPTFLAESKIMPRAAVDRLMRCSGPGNDSGSYGGSGCGSLKSWINDPAVPITLYTEAAAKSTFTAQFYGTASLNKLAPMNRNDNFTKLMGDPNKQVDY